MIFITGASGKLGYCVYRMFDGRIIPLVRRRCGLKNEIVTSFDFEELKRILKDARVIIHIAGSTEFWNRKSLWKGNVELTEKIVNSIPEKSLILFASSVSVYGSNPPMMADENTPINPDSEYARTKAIAEEIVRSHPNYVIFRIGPIYGEMYKIYFKFFSIMERGIVPVIGSGNNRIPFIYVRDVACCFVKAIKKDLRGIYIICGKPKRQRDIMIYSAKKLTNSFTVIRIPKNVAYASARVCELIGRGITREHIKVLACDRVFKIEKAKKDLGFQPISIWSGIDRMIRAYRRNKYGKG